MLRRLACDVPILRHSCRNASKASCAALMESLEDHEPLTREHALRMLRAAVSTPVAWQGRDIKEVTVLRADLVAAGLLRKLCAIGLPAYDFYTPHVQGTLWSLLPKMKEDTQYLDALHSRDVMTIILKNAFEAIPAPVVHAETFYSKKMLDVRRRQYLHRNPSIELVLEKRVVAGCEVLGARDSFVRSSELAVHWHLDMQRFMMLYATRLAAQDVRFQQQALAQPFTLKNMLALYDYEEMVPSCSAFLAAVFLPSPVSAEDAVNSGVLPTLVDIARIGNRNVTQMANVALFFFGLRHVRPSASHDAEEMSSKQLQGLIHRSLEAVVEICHSHSIEVGTNDIDVAAVRSLVPQNSKTSIHGLLRAFVEKCEEPQGHVEDIIDTLIQVPKSEDIMQFSTEEKLSGPRRPLSGKLMHEVFYWKPV